MEIIQKYFPGLSENQINQFRSLGRLYHEWNEKINVISRKDIEHLYLRHVLHSLSIGRYISFSPGTNIMDLGTGGGFPGIPLAILFPHARFLLVDSVAKKIRVVNEICRSVGLTNTTSIAERAENIKGRFDFVVTRAVTTLPRLVQWVQNKITPRSKNSVPNGILALKGGDLAEELKGLKYAAVIDLKNYFTGPFFEEKKLVHIAL